jgi:tricarballylate dehydrogenase
MTLPEHTEVLVVGGGHAALSAAITAAEAGASVLLLERAPKVMRGGNTRHTRNLRSAHSEPIAGLKASYSDEEYWQDLLRVTGGNTDETLARLTIRDSEPLIQWLLTHGVHFQPSLSGTLSLERTNAFFLGGGCALLNALYLTAESLGVNICYDCHVSQLSITNNTCQSVSVTYGDIDYEVSADAVVAACGGFQSNEAWMKKVWGDAADNFLIRGTPYNEGHVLQNLLESGVASVGDPAQCHAVAIDARAPKYDGGIVTRLDCVPFSIVVNNACQRFYDEGEDFWPKRYAIWGRLVAAQPDQIAYAIIDSKVINNFMPSVFPAIEADSLNELATKLGLAPSGLTETVNNFNHAVLPGEYDPSTLDTCSTTDLIPAKSHWARTIDAAPFYAYPLRPGITFTYLGVKVDAEARVQLTDGRAVNNLYAAGEIMAGNILGQGYCAGTGMTIGGVFGRIAGSQAACHSA